MKGGYIIKHFSGTILFFSILFISAGKLDYLQGIIYVALGFLMGVLNYTVLKPDPGLLAERSKPGAGAEKWDKTILGLSFLMTLSMYIVAGLDSGRYRWSPDFHPALVVTGIIFTAAGQLLFLVAQKQNKFFSSTVRIQKERGHTVCDTGLYKLVRHPAYFATVIQAAGFPLLFGSVWSIIPVFVIIALQFIRTSFEDKKLREELPGYSEYSLKTRYRLLPFIW
jgi:protein-S-isoprenylcysteine O-methyltransferase Ste14